MPSDSTAINSRHTTDVTETTTGSRLIVTTTIDTYTSQSPPETTESSTVNTKYFSESSIPNTSPTSTSISLSSSFDSTSEESSRESYPYTADSFTYSAPSTSTDDYSSVSSGTDYSDGPPVVAIVLTIIFILLLTVAVILLYIRYRKKIPWCKQKIERKENSGSDNGFASHHITNEMEQMPSKSSLCQSTEAPPTTDDSQALRTSHDRPSEALPTINQLKRITPTSDDSSKPPPIANRNTCTETPPPRHKRNTKTKSCQLAYAPPPPDENFMDCIKRHQDNLILYQKEFDCLPDGAIKSSSVAREQQNIVKNRYVNVLPYDCNRVVLPKKSEDDSDFINASFIDGAVKKNAYISTQGPMSSTLPDFWSMIWDNNSHRILMLTNLSESIRGVKNVKTGKCTQYWPLTIGQQNTYGDIEVKLLKESVERDWTVRSLAVKKEGCDTVRTVQQYHYTTWPDQDVPHTSTAILKFHRLSLQSADNDDSSGPVVVHCSAGVGRTGTLIAIDILAEKWKETQPQCDVYKCVQSLRQQRMSMVQSVRQYMFIHHSLIQEFRIGVSVEQTPQKTLEQRLTTEELEEQFAVLDATSVISIAHCSVSKSKPKKNRSPNILPSNSLIRFLKPVKEDDNVYINAVPVNGFQESNAFFVTQMTLNDTINDFWRLANDTGCHVIVMLNSSFNDDERYWPIDDDVMKTKSFLIKRTGSGSGTSRDGLVTTDLKIQFNGIYKKTDDSSSEDDEDSSGEDSLGRRSGSHDLEGLDLADPSNQSSTGDPADPWRPVLHLRVRDWPETQPFPSDPSILLGLYEQLTQIRARHPKGSIIIQCMYGADRSGLFCAIVNILDRLIDQGIVGIFDAVKLIKERRQQFVPDIEHYNYLHQLVNIYLNQGKEKETKADVSRDGQAMRQEKKTTEERLTKSGKRSTVAGEVTRDGKKPEDRRMSSNRVAEKEQRMGRSEYGSLGVVEEVAVPIKEGKVTQDAKEIRDVATIHQTPAKGNITDSKEPQGKGITEASSEPKQMAPGIKESQEKVIIQGSKEQSGTEIVQKPKDTKNANDIKEVPVRETSEAAEKVKEKHIMAPAVRETHEKRNSLNAKDAQEKGKDQVGLTTEPKEIEIIQLSQEKTRAIIDNQLSEEEENITKC